MQYSVMSQGVFEISTKKLNWNTLNSVDFFYNDKYSIDDPIDESNFSYNAF